MPVCTPRNTYVYYANFFTGTYHMGAMFGHLLILTIWLIFFKKRCRRRINFSTNRDHSNTVFLNNNIKFCDMIKLYHLMFVKVFINKNLPHVISKTLHLMKIFVHMIHTLHLHQVHTCAWCQQQRFGWNSFKYKAAYEWNQFSMVQPQITNENSTTSIKRLILCKNIKLYHFY